MLSEEVISTVSGPQIAANTAVPKDVGIYSHTLSPSWAVKATFKKSSTPINCLAVSKTHVFSAQDQKAHVHVYSRERGNQETLVSFQEKIRSVAISGNVLILGTAEGRLILWEISTGRQVTTPPCHVQAISCLATTSTHVLTASDDANVNVWSLARLLEYGAEPGFEPDRVLSNHRAAITALVAGPGDNAETSICVSASKDKTCIVWNYQTGQVLRTLLFPSIPLCATLDPSARALVVSTDDGSVFVVEFFGDKPLLGSRSAEMASIVVQVDSPLGVVEPESDPAICLALNYDGSTLLTGHAKGRILQWELTDKSQPSELTNLNAAVTNLAFVPPLKDNSTTHQITTVVKPNLSQRQYALTTQLAEEPTSSRFARMMNTQGFSEDIIQDALQSFTASAPSTSAGATSNSSDEIAELQRQNAELQEIVNEQKALHKATAASR